jgi:hypothetical protein
MSSGTSLDACMRTADESFREYIQNAAYQTDLAIKAAFHNPELYRKKKDLDRLKSKNNNDYYRTSAKESTYS